MNGNILLLGISGSQLTGYRLRDTGHGIQVTGYRLQDTGYGFTGYGFTDYGLRITYFEFMGSCVHGFTGYGSRIRGLRILSLRLAYLLQLRVAREQGLLARQLGKDASHRPDVHGGGVVRATQEHLAGFRD